MSLQKKKNEKNNAETIYLQDLFKAFKQIKLKSAKF